MFERPSQVGLTPPGSGQVSPASSLVPPSPPGGQLRARAAQLSELLEVATVITEVFHPPGDWLAWLSPVLRLGIYQDLRQRLLSSRAAGYTCLVCDWQQLETASSAAKMGSHSSQQAKIVGTVEINLRSVLLQSGKFLTDQPYLSNLAVQSQYRQQGVGKALLLACEATVRAWGYQDLYLHVLENNHAARKLYTQLGYRLRQADFPWATLLGQPQQLLLHKHLP